MPRAGGASGGSLLPHVLRRKVVFVAHQELNKPAGIAPQAPLLRDIARALGETATLADAAPRMLAAVCEALGWKYGGLFLADRAGHALRCVGTWQQPNLNLDAFAKASRETQFTKHVGLPGRVWASGEPAWIPDVTRDDNFPRAAVAVDEIADGIYRIATPLDIPGDPHGFSFNQYLVADDEPLLYHTGPRKLFPLIRDAVARVMPVDELRWISFSHYEADECGSLNDWLAQAPGALPLCGAIAAMTSPR